MEAAVSGIPSPESRQVPHLEVKNEVTCSCRSNYSSTQEKQKFYFDETGETLRSVAAVIGEVLIYSNLWKNVYRQRFCHKKKQLYKVGESMSEQGNRTKIFYSSFPF